jgi:hypothetical protein
MSHPMRRVRTGAVTFGLALLLALLTEPKLLPAAYQAGSLNSAASPGTVFMLYPGSLKDPIVLLSGTHNAEKDLLESGIAKNVGSSPVTAYRIGWILLPRDPAKPPEVQLGRIANLTEGVGPGAEFNVVGQGASPTLMNGVRAIVFFVAEAGFSDGTGWKADNSQIQSLYFGKSGGSPK